MTDEEEDVAFLVLRRVTLYDQAMPESKPVRTNCGHSGWIAPSSVAWLAGEGAGAYIVCTDCATSLPQMDPDGLTLRSVPGSREEFEQHFGPNYGRLLAKFLDDQWKKPR